jgi:3-oxoacyl-[acyl-carrier protein] reductase
MALCCGLKNNCPSGPTLKEAIRMDLGLKNKVAVVAAASRGLGRAAAEALAAEGARLAICSRDAARIEEAGAKLTRKHGTQVLALACDVVLPEEVSGFRKRVLETYGTVHILFTNAGGPPPGGLLDKKTADFETALRLNLLSTIDLIYAFLPAMREQHWGRIIASTSITLKQPILGLSLSNVSRVGVAAFVKNLSLEVASAGITANTVAPGYIMTERVRQILEARVRAEGVSYDEALKSAAAEIPAGRIGTPAEFGALVAFLASEQASYVTGETILIDGGLYRGLF